MARSPDQAKNVNEDGAGGGGRTHTELSSTGLLTDERSANLLLYINSAFFCDSSPLRPPLPSPPPPHALPRDGGTDALIGPPTRPASLLSARGTARPVQVAITPAGGIISGQSLDIPQEGPCAGLRRRGARLFRGDKCQGLLSLGSVRWLRLWEPQCSWVQLSCIRSPPTPMTLSRHSPKRLPPRRGS